MNTSTRINSTAIVHYRGLLLLSLLVFLIFGCQSKHTGRGEIKRLPVKEYQKAVYASWIGQIIGNTYGLGYEFRYIDDPGPDSFPYGYAFTLDQLDQYNGAFSDDDTDIEYMYLTQMEAHGIEPSYYQLAEAWKRHVKERIWFANRMAVTLMHAGHYPPVTGKVGYNSEWFQIDPQLVNEIWAVTAPGMGDYAVAKSRFSARITSDSFGLEPTLHYAAMYSAAFFEKDVNRLIDIGLSALQDTSRFARAVRDVKTAYETHPHDWQKAREEIKNRYYRVEPHNRHSWAAADAILNGAFGILALLYGQGDFQNTLDYCCAFGMDADNQAATMCGLLGIVNGIEGIPHELMFPLEGTTWEKPFNDSYKMITREGLADSRITALAERTALQGEKIILAHGGDIVDQEGELIYFINTGAAFKPPFELNPIPDQYCEINTLYSYPLYTGIQSGDLEVSTVGDLPPGIQVSNDRIEGTPTRTGMFEFTISVKQGEEKKTIPVRLVVRSENLATSASEILFNTQAIDTAIDLIRDGKTDRTYYSMKQGDIRTTDYYGYRWTEPVEIAALAYNTGAPHEFSGWFTAFRVEYLANGEWVILEQPRIDPEMNLDNSQWMKPAFMTYNISFPRINTSGIRISGLSGGIEKDEANAHLGIQYYTSISELKVFKD